MSTIDILPAAKLAEAMKAPPDALTETQIAASSLDDLDAAAKIIEEKNYVINEKARERIRARFEILKGLEKTDEALANLYKRVHLMRLLEIKASVAPAPSRMDFVASLLSGAAAKTEGIPVIGFVTSFFKDMKGRSIERAWFNVLATFEKNPAVASATSSVVLGPIGSMVGLLGINFGARERLLTFDIQDAIAAEKIASEKISFSGVAKGDLEKFKDKLASVNIMSATTQYVRDQRKLLPSGTEIIVSLEAILNTEKTQADIVQKEVTRKKNIVIAQWKPLDISEVTFGTTVSAKKNGTGRFEITVPEGELADGSPSSTATKTLQLAMTTLSNAKEISIVPETESLTIDTRAKSIKIPADSMDITPSLNGAFSVTQSRLGTIVFDDSELSSTTMQAKFVPKTLLLGSNSERMTSLDHLSGLCSLLSDATSGDLFVYNGGSWRPSTPTPISA